MRNQKGALILAALLALQASSCGNQTPLPSSPATTVAAAPSPSPSPSGDPCTVINGFHAVTLQRNGKTVHPTPAAGWHFDETPTVELVPIYLGDTSSSAWAMANREVRRSDSTADCPQFNEAQGWNFAPAGECRWFSDNVRSASGQLRCRRPIEEGLTITTLLPDPNNPTKSIVVESLWNVGS